MRYICSVTTGTEESSEGSSTGYVDADEPPSIGHRVTINVEQDDGSVHQVSGTVDAIFDDGELWW